MSIGDVELLKEQKILNKVNKLLTNTLDSLGVDVNKGEDDLVEFKKIDGENKNLSPSDVILNAGGKNIQNNYIING